MVFQMGCVPPKYPSWVKGEDWNTGVEVLPFHEVFDISVDVFPGCAREALLT